MPALQPMVTGTKTIVLMPTLRLIYVLRLHMSAALENDLQKCTEMALPCSCMLVCTQVEILLTLSFASLSVIYIT